MQKVDFFFAASIKLSRYPQREKRERESERNVMQSYLPLIKCLDEAWNCKGNPSLNHQPMKRLEKIVVVYGNRSPPPLSYDYLNRQIMSIIKLIGGSWILIKNGRLILSPLWSICPRDICLKKCVLFVRFLIGKNICLKKVPNIFAEITSLSLSLCTSQPAKQQVHNTCPTTKLTWVS